MDEKDIRRCAIFLLIFVYAELRLDWSHFTLIFICLPSMQTLTANLSIPGYYGQFYFTNEAKLFRFLSRLINSIFIPSKTALKVSHVPSLGYKNKIDKNYIPLDLTYGSWGNENEFKR